MTLVKFDVAFTFTNHSYCIEFAFKPMNRNGKRAYREDVGLAMHQSSLIITHQSNCYIIVQMCKMSRNFTKSILKFRRQNYTKKMGCFNSLVWPIKGVASYFRDDPHSKVFYGYVKYAVFDGQHLWEHDLETVRPMNLSNMKSFIMFR